ncbi:hypothetical protein DPMN_180583 [Dreissena polymorpha]|uniref:Uncharacterized protein n=1 Tax=Dreissena polymorpha TaxID=45954 RepID=A0A9D4INA4_DREPO|nr:hypothetical protein DPMN_180583 [Dreissena polymorpha]
MFLKLFHYRSKTFRLSIKEGLKGIREVSVIGKKAWKCMRRREISGGNNEEEVKNIIEIEGRGRGEEGGGYCWRTMYNGAVGKAWMMKSSLYVRDLLRIT